MRASEENSEDIRGEMRVSEEECRGISAFHMRTVRSSEENSEGFRGTSFHRRAYGVSIYIYILHKRLDHYYLFYSVYHG